ncbi:hypothetical protein DFH07DRAFT_951937 [Mycena maculata]|uniref:Uncharacterized protein n=1 Tax=Mycena maculata TaxID=230809 RepID=A0AAD7K590_9AGAR|nr:hypothetical protein DFH07DRAFT_951937 [Mycena maculata]
MAFGQPTPAPEVCMSLPSALLVGPSSQSFEEVRISDYLTSYRATGRPPPPVPAFPAEPAARTAQGLPPLFTPTPFPDSSAPGAFGPFGVGASASGSGASAIASTSARITDPARLPVSQALPAPVPVPGEGESFASISAAPDFLHWSPEELRYYAYLRNTRAPPPGTPPFVLPATASAPAAAAGPSILFGSGPGAGGAPLPENGDQFMSITARPEFAGHSVEELRLSYLRTGAELTSAQIFAGATSSNPPSHAPPAPRPTLNPISTLAPSPFAAPPQPAFGAPPAPAAQGFSFGGAPSQPAQPSMFGRAQPAPSMFGAPAPQPHAPSLFGQPPAQPHAPSIFGAPASAPAPPPPATQGFTFGAAPATGGGGGAGFVFGGRRG